MSDAATPYRVLARKYRPRTLAELVGQDALVRTVTNAFKSGRIAHAFLFTGVRGVGKTSTARIIARGLNCVGPDGHGGPTPEPCGVCEPCVAIAEDRHVDVIEMDAASHTGVNDVRELIDGVRYRPAAARYKVYIIDEVHMLSGSAFNALLKTLEEPPPHVIFLFATTEVRKLPVTVLSRCQRFDLRRVDAATLIAHFGRIAEAEAIPVSPGALALIARAADGSVRDGLSLLDQAIAHAGGTVDEPLVREMLGLADRAQVIELFEQLMGGDPAAALRNLEAQYAAGADPSVVLADLLEFTHWLTRLKVVPEAADDPTAPEAERAKGRELSAKLSMAALNRAWQILFKGAGDARFAADPLQAVEMTLIRLAYAANLPTPAEALSALGAEGDANAREAQPRTGAARGEPAGRAASPVSAGPPARASAPPAGAPQAALRMAPEAAAPDARPALIRPATFAEVVALTEAKREPILHSLLVHETHLVHFEPGRIELRMGPAAAARVPNQLARLLQEWTGQRWVIALSNETGEATLAERAEAARVGALEEVARHPVVKAALDLFPGARIKDVRPLPPEHATSDEPTDGPDIDEPDEEP
ncbi:MAG: DNA polymerase III subunit gamma/tau [Alphaproteobacteria bacterium]